MQIVFSFKMSEIKKTEIGFDKIWLKKIQIKLNLLDNEKNN